MTCNEFSACFKALFFPLLLTIIVIGALALLGFGHGLSDEVNKQLMTIILDGYAAALVWANKNE